MLEAQPPGPELVAAYTWAAGRRMFTRRGCGGRRWGRASARARRATRPPGTCIRARTCAVWRAATLAIGGRRRRARALGARARTGPGTGDRRHLRQPLRWDLGFEGVQPAFDAIREAIAFSQRRGITEIALQNSSSSLPCWPSSDRPRRLSPRPGRSRIRSRRPGTCPGSPYARCSCGCSPKRALPKHAPDPEPLLAAAREIGLPDMITDALTAVRASPSPQGDREQAHALLAELGRLGGDRSRTGRLPASCRTCSPLATSRSPKNISKPTSSPCTPRSQARPCLGRAQLAEANGDHAQAATLYADAAERWASSATSPNAPTPSSAKAAASRARPRRSRSPTRRSSRSCSPRWATSRRWRRPSRCWGRRPPHGKRRVNELSADSLDARRPGKETTRPRSSQLGSRSKPRLTDQRPTGG